MKIIINLYINIFLKKSLCCFIGKECGFSRSQWWNWYVLNHAPLVFRRWAKHTTPGCSGTTAGQRWWTLDQATRDILKVYENVGLNFSNLGMP